MKRAFRRKNAISVAVAILLILSMVACQGKQVIEEPESNADFSGQPVSPAEVQPAEDTAALYELAKAEGQVVIYSVSSRISAFQEDFEKTYPGISVEAYKLKTGDIITKVKTEKDAGNVNADVVYTRDISGAMKIDFMANGYLNSYLPGDIQEKMYEPFKSNADTAIGYVELRTIFYNTDAYPDGSPIQNWWDLTTDEWRGRLIMQDPLLISDTMDLFMAFSQHSDEMAAAYKLKFGENLALSEGCKDAGYEFVKRLLANDPVLMSSEGDCTTAVGLSKEAKAPVAIAVSSKMRDAISLKNLLGLICDPIAGPIEVPCIKRNSVGVANAFAAADMALAGIRSFIPPDEVLDALRNVQELLPRELKGTTVGGLACTQTAIRVREHLRN